MIGHIPLSRAPGSQSLQDSVAIFSRLGARPALRLLLRRYASCSIVHHMDVEIQTHHVDMQPDWRALIDERLARLAERYPKLIRVHVTLRHGRHHLRGVEE